MNLEHKTATSSDSRKNRFGLISIVCSLIGMLLSFLIKKPFVDVIHIGFIFAFLGMILSMPAVKEHGKNTVALAAFWISFAALWIATGMGASYI